MITETNEVRFARYKSCGYTHFIMYETQHKDYGWVPGEFPISAGRLAAYLAKFDNAKEGNKVRHVQVIEL